jgi:cytochrome c biogenesis protein CcdA/thiol-disulfide isomerase/thioredoxin
MLILVVVGLLAGIITSISPCVLPVLPVVLAASAEDTPERHSRWRPYGVVAGLVISFSASTLFGSLVLTALHLPQDLLRDAGIVVLVVIGLSLVVPRLGELLERPFARLPHRAVNPKSNGVVLGLGLGLLFVPCAGPVLAAIAVVGATHHFGLGAVVLTAAFGIGAGIPLLIVAVAGGAIARRTGVLRRRARSVRLASGVVMIVVAAAIGLNLTDGLQRHVPGYTTALQKSVEQNGSASSQLRHLTTTGKTKSGPGDDAACTEGGPTPENCGKAPAFAGINAWLNTPGGRPLSLASLRGKVVLIDFWTYSCINCQRALPHVEAWYRDYKKDGLVVVGVHTPEFAFEHVTSNVRAQAGALGVKYPVAVDNDYGTWNAYHNQYWPAEYLIDATGEIRHISFGEGDYAGTETVIRQLLVDAHPRSTLARPTDVPNTTPTEEQTPETYLGYKYPLDIAGPPPDHDRSQTHQFPSTLDADKFALSGTWTDTAEALTAGPAARLELSYQAEKVYLVLGGTGSVIVRIDGRVTSTIHVDGVPKLYTLANRDVSSRSLLRLDVTPGVRAYDFTFG